jgi:dipeptidyl aminopeptidase/acylaminoacyl peptidase
MEDGVRSAQFSPDGKRVVTGSAYKIARVWDAQTGQPLTQPMEHDDDVLSAQFSSDGTWIVTASRDKTARVWDAQTGQPLTGPMKHRGPVFSARFSPDGKRVVTASEDNTACVWDVLTGRPLTEQLNHSSFVSSAQFSPDGKCIVTASDNAARVWDAQSGQPLTEPLKHGGGGNSAQFSPDGKRVVTARGDARVWDIAPMGTGYPDWLLPLAEAICGQAFNKQGLLEATRLHRAETLNQIRQRLNQEPDGGDWAIWGRWLLSDHATRTISPFSTITVPEYNANRAKEKTAEPGEPAKPKGP